jgi:ApbE superfamily uncharacterized protein (UPF0280 family)
MSYEQSIAFIDGESVLAECGPMRLIIRAWDENKPQIDLIREAADKSFTYLERIAGFRSELSRPFPEIKEKPQDDLAMEMVNSVGIIGDHDLTPMAAVAGTIADAVADWLFEREVTRVIVDNGGDIAVRLAEGETVTVGVRPQVISRHISHVIYLDSGRSTWGVTTSGVGGRSLTRGIASAVTVLANNASVADAAATAIGNACYVKDDLIIQMPAEKIDPTSDLKDIPATTEVGPLSSEKILTAINSARKKADDLAQKGFIVGAFIALGGVYTMTDGIKRYIQSVQNS